MTAQDFVLEVLVGGLNPSMVAAGEDFRFGKDRAGDLALLESLGSVHHFEVLGVGLVGDSDAMSSSRIRALITAGEVVDASRMLGRAFEVTGSVVSGAGRGASIGFPTANISLAPELLLPGRGVYAVRAAVDGGAYDAVANIGVRPTFGIDSEDILEVHLLDESLDLSAKPISVSFVARLRDEQRFDGIDALRSQIAHDIDVARTMLATRTP